MTAIRTTATCLDRERAVEEMVLDMGQRIEATSRQLALIRQHETERQEARDALVAAVALVLWGRGLAREAEEVTRHGV